MLPIGSFTLPACCISLLVTLFYLSSVSYLLLKWHMFQGNGYDCCGAFYEFTIV